MRFKSDELIALYLLEHPEDEYGITTITIDGADMQMMARDVLGRFASWGALSGHFDKEKVQEFIPWLAQLNTGKRKRLK